MGPSVSVIIPTHNYSNFLHESVESVLAQTFSDFELIIVDDGSTDDTVDVVKRFLRDRRVRYIYQDNKGPSAARNAGIKAAAGEFIALLDADDVWLPTKLERQIQLSKDEPDAALIYCMVEHIDEHGKSLPCITWPRKDYATYKDLMYIPWVEGSCSSALIRKSIFDEVGLFDESMTGVEDTNMWIRILRHHKSACVKDILVKIRKHLNSRQTDVKMMEENNLRHVQKCIELFPELKDYRKDAYFHIYEGLLYLSYISNKKRNMLVYYMKAGFLRPSFYYESVVAFFRKYFFRNKKLY
ncbi:MAG: glycosyltransferase family 2 protein [Candidatus Sulfobium sp.]